MSLVGEQVLMRVYLQNADRAPHVPTHERIVAAARKEKLAGATVIHGILGAGYHGIVKSSRWSFVEHVPVIVEIVDEAQRIANFIHGPLDSIMVGGMLTLERAAVIMYRKALPHRPPSTATAMTCPKCGSGNVPVAAQFCPTCGAELSSEPGLHDARDFSLKLAGELEPLSTVPRIQPGAHMTINENGVLLRVFIGESDRFQGKPLYEAIVEKVRTLGLAGATVLRGNEGFGAHSVVHRSTLLEMSTDLPIVIEIVDKAENVQLLIPHLETMVQEGMVTMEYVTVLMYRHGPQPA